ncbi:radical SAM protein [Breznakiella homolactica]|uniref:Radical SAM protein n=2 Tax=Breznakiella homolactica TaxID=2798577 RepID=A0A7T8BC91_9SPIR|nr:radical SAM protein [Breznakiella homolactica]
MSSKRKLESVFLFVTGKCNAKCAMCFYAGEMDKKEPELTFDEIKKISETAGEFNRLWLSGGEPTLREDLPEIIELFYKNNKVKDINFPSNGIKGDLIVEWLKRLRKSCPDANLTISISIDGFGSTHDTQRGVPSFYHAAETLQKIDDNFGDDGQILKNVATVITKYNVEELMDFMLWAYGRFNISTHTVEAARGMTREDGVKILTEKSLREIQDKIVPYYAAYGDRIAEGVDSRMGKKIARFFYLGLMRSLYNIRASNIDKPTPWGMDCTAGETTLVIDYDGRFRSCELRDPIGNVKDYGCDIQAIMNGDAMKKEIADVGHGYTANCWCTHGCWIMSSIVFNPAKMVRMLFKANRETKKLNRPVAINENVLRDLESKYQLDSEKLAQIGLI